MITKALSSSIVFNSVGVNHHIDFGNEPGLAIAIGALNYLGLKHVRDCPDNPSCVGLAGTWQNFANATGAKFCAYLTEGSVADMQRDLGMIKQIAAQGIIEFVEGGNEEDDAYPKSRGNTIAATLAFQKSDVWPLGQALHIPVIMMSFGAGWTAANKYHGDYDKIGDASAWCNYGNAHTYPNPGQRTDKAITQLNADARLATPSKQIITTEIGWPHTEAGVERFVQFAVLDGIAYGNPMSYFYALFDDSSGAWGLFNNDGSPRPAATALRNLMQAFADTGPSRGDTLDYSIVGTANDNSLLLQRSDGTFMLAIWNEVDADHPVKVILPGVPRNVALWDTVRRALKPMAGTPTMTITVPNYPVILEFVVSIAPTITRPTNFTGAVGQVIPLAGISIDDAWAANHPGSLALTVVTSIGTLGSGGQSMRSNGNLTEINLALAGLSLTSTKAGAGKLTVSVWNQQGTQTSVTIAISVK